MRGHHGAYTVGEDGGFERGGCRLVLDGGFGVDDFQSHTQRKFDGDGDAVEQAYYDSREALGFPMLKK